MKKNTLFIGYTIHHTKTSIKKVNAAVESGDKAAAEAALKDASSTIDKAKSKGIYHKNTASRKVSRMASAVSKMA